MLNIPGIALEFIEAFQLFDFSIRINPSISRLVFLKSFIINCRYGIHISFQSIALSGLSLLSLK